jgi:hypothetical protein
MSVHRISFFTTFTIGILNGYSKGKIPKNIKYSTLGITSGFHILGTITSLSYNPLTSPLIMVLIPILCPSAVLTTYYLGNLLGEATLSSFE